MDRKILCLGLVVVSLGYLQGHERQFSIDEIKTFPFRYFAPELDVGRAIPLYFEQDSEGYVWIATDNGLFRFDGHTFVRYAHDLENIHSLSDDFVLSLLLDSSDLLWVGTNTGLHRCRPDHNDFERIPLILNASEGTSTSPIKRIVEDVDGRIYLATSGGGVKLLEKESLESYALSTVTRNPPQEMGEWVVNRIYLEKPGVLWISTVHHGIFRYFSKTGQLQAASEIVELDNTLNGYEVRSFFKDSSGNLWIGTHGNGIIRWNEEARHLVHYAKGPEGDRPLRFESIRHMLEDQNGYIWVSTQDAGIFIYDHEADAFVGIPHLESVHPRLSEEIITAMFMDNRGDLWFSAIYSGIFYIFYLNLDPTGFRYAVIENDEGENINKIPVLSYFEDSSGNAWLGTDGHGLIRWDGDSYEAFVHDEADPRSIGSNVITVITEDEWGNLWLGSRGDGLLKWDRQTRAFSSIHSGNTAASVRGYSIWSLLPDKGLLWIGTDQGLSVIDLLSGEAVNPKELLGEGFSMPKRAVWSMIRDRNERLLICSISGFYVAKPSKYPRVSTALERSFRRVSELQVRAVYEDTQGQIWVAAFPGGLYQLEGDDDLVRPFQEGWNFESDNLLSMTEDSEGGLWVTSHLGFSRLDIKTGEASVFDSNWVKDSQLLWVHRNVLGKDGNVYFPSRKGLLFYDVRQIYREQVSLEPRLTGIEVFGKDVSSTVSSSDSLFINPTQNDLILKHTESALTFHFSAMYFPQPEDVEYQVFLDGYDDEWRPPTSLSRTSYKLLPPGDYALNLRARISGQEWGEVTIPLALTVLPPLYFRWWFMSGSILLLVVFVYALMRIRIKESEKQRVGLERMVNERTLQLAETNDHISRQRDELEYHRNHLEELVKDRTEELESAKERAEESSRLKTAFLANMSHEIRTPLNSIVNFSQLLFDHQISEQERLRFKDIVENSSDNLLRLIEDVLDVARLESGELKLNIQPCDMVALMGRLKEIYADKIRSRRLPLSLNLHCPDEFRTEILIDATRLNQVLVNLLDNALKFTEEGVIEFGFFAEEKEVTFFVKDSGIGISGENLERIFDRFTKIEDDKRKIFPGAGLGLAIVKRLVALLGGSLRVESELGKGSTFAFSIPNTPFVKEDNAQSEPELKRNFNWSSNTILVVEDEYSNVEVLRAYLKPTEAKVLFVADGKQAVDKVRQEATIDLVLMDLKLPVMDGVSATREIRRFNQEVPIIAQTAYSVSHERINTLKNGFNDYVTKPLNRDRLLSSIDHHLKRR